MQSFSLIKNLVLKVFPLVNTELAYWRDRAAENCEPALSAQALASIQSKKFHCQGGGVYCLYPGTPTRPLVRLIVALQTISDYLDNLCDRAGITDEKSFRQLHLAIADALTPGKPPENYYAFYPYKNDGGYLTSLVLACQDEISRLPSYHLVQDYNLEFAQLYSELQTYKHVDWSIREQRMLAWITPHLSRYPGISPWEFAAATGSTLGMFMMCALASDPELIREKAANVFSAYFPWISGLHILMDYFIDRAEDREGGDLNFAAYYQSEDEILSRLTLFWHEAMKHARSLPDSAFHETVIHGLFAMYLSDPKTNAPQEKAIKNSLLKTAGPYTKLLYGLCKLLRSQKLL